MSSEGKKFRKASAKADAFSVPEEAAYRATGESFVEKNIDKLSAFFSWVVWYPDLFMDLLKTKGSGFQLHLDQRVFLRCSTRFFSMYGCFPRGWGKTFLEVLAAIVVCICYPNMEIAITAQTKENAAALLKDKFNEIVRIWPMLENELKKNPPKFSTHDAEIVFKNNSRLDILSNTQSSKGQRRRRLNIEESVLLNNELFEDALKPVVEVPRYTTGKLSVVNPEELNQQIHFFSTPGKYAPSY